MNPTKKTARLAGVLYLLLAITGAYSIIYVSTKIRVLGDAVATADNILAHEFLFRTGIVSSQVSNIIFLFLAFVLYRLLKEVNEHRAKLMVAFVIVQIPIGLLNGALDITSVLILKGEVLKTFQLEQKQDFVMLLQNQQIWITASLEIFWGLWLIPFGQLVYKSGFLPRFLGVLLIIGGIGYMLESFTFLLFPEYFTFISKFAMILYSPGEIITILWLLLKGVKVQTAT